MTTQKKTLTDFTPIRGVGCNPTIGGSGAAAPDKGDSPQSRTKLKSFFA